MTLQELDTINAIAIKAGFDFGEMICIIGIGAASSGALAVNMGRRDMDKKCRSLCDSIEVLQRSTKEGDKHV